MNILVNGKALKFNVECCVLRRKRNDEQRYTGEIIITSSRKMSNYEMEKVGDCIEKLIRERGLLK